MEYVTLKNSGLCVSRLCIGGDPMGGHAWGETHDAELTEAVHAALDCGINFFDTADCYGLGKAERLLGDALQGCRDKVVIASKFGVRRSADNTATFYDNSVLWMRQAVEGSLRRLRTDYIDVYQIHYLDGRTPICDVVDGLEELRREGKIRYYGLSNVYRKDIGLLQPYKSRFVSFQNQYSLACRDHEDEIGEVAASIDATPLTWGSLGQGILTGKYGRDVVFDAGDRRSRPTYPNFHGEKLQKNIDIVDAMRRMGPKYGKRPAAIAIRFILDNLDESAVIVGVKRKAQVLSNAEAADWHLGQEDKALLDALSA